MEITDYFAILYLVQKYNTDPEQSLRIENFCKTKIMEFKKEEL